MQPALIYRSAQPYAAIRTQVAFDEIGRTLPPLVDEVEAWIRAQGAAPAGAPFFRYLVVDGAPLIDVEAGLPVASPMAGDDRVSTGELPAGTYAVVRHVGPYDGIYGTTEALMAWAEANGVRWLKLGDGSTWASWVESYLTDPATEADPQRWVTEIAILTES